MRGSSLPFTLAILAALTVLCAACGGSADGPSEEAWSDDDAARAARLFQNEDCVTCHGEQADGIEGMGPALRDLSPYWDTVRLAAYLEDPDGFREANPDFELRRSEEYELEMPPYDHLALAERRLLARWLLMR
jgi:mono/diheme cytochrome c family protein